MTPDLFDLDEVGMAQLPDNLEDANFLRRIAIVVARDEFEGKKPAVFFPFCLPNATKTSPSQKSPNPETRTKILANSYGRS
jgi:hypothetical protein